MDSPPLRVYPFTASADTDATHRYPPVTAASEPYLDRCEGVVVRLHDALDADDKVQVDGVGYVLIKDMSNTGYAYALGRYWDDALGEWPQVAL